MNLQIGVALLPQMLPRDWARGQTMAVVIDTLRFTSTACVALEAGAEAIAVMSDIEAARRLATDSQPAKLLCGERHCTKIPGFDLGNSPLEYTPERVGQRQLIFSTTNGTVAVETAQPAQLITLGSLLNRAALVSWLRSQPFKTCWIVCAGTDGEVAFEDVLTAGAILDLLWNSSGSPAYANQMLNDAAWLAVEAWRSVQRDSGLVERLKTARGGRNLIEAGFESDIEFVAQLDRCQCVPLLRENLFRQS